MLRRVFFHDPPVFLDEIQVIHSVLLSKSCTETPGVACVEQVEHDTFSVLGNRLEIDIWSRCHWMAHVGRCPLLLALTWFKPIMGHELTVI